MNMVTEYTMKSSDTNKSPFRRQHIYVHSEFWTLYEALWKEAEKIGYSHQMKDEFIKKVKDNIDFYVMSFHIGIGANQFNFIPQTEVVEEEILNLEHDFVKVYNEIEQGRYAISKHEIAKWQKIPLNKLIILE
ncbi:hypothetical protein W5A_12436 [Imtechella halotolerans K1]|uniref:Uncharacterized protein n=2 Tax=Imtechella TaxID=1165076 RepID=I0W7E7_9FLAO|nr:hypothetical protein W5A_12436 [Imtechella halotolerans K1]